MLQVESIFLSLSILIIISITIARLSNNIGVPVMLLFLGIGMLAGSEGPGGIYFDDAGVAQIVGIISLIFILFSGGLDTKWSVVKPTLIPALSLATVGVLITTVLVGLFTYFVFKLPLYVSFLLGSIVASTDAAAVFSIIGARNLKLKGKITPLLELESGSNDPMAVFLTISFLELITGDVTNMWKLGLNFVLEMGIGLLLGVGLGKLIVHFINWIKFPIEGFYTVFVLSAAISVYSLTSLIHGSGFLAVYIAGIVLNNNNFVFKKNIFRFFDGLAWLSQIAMFLTLGLLVFPSQILPAIKTELIIAFFLIFIARPVGVFISLIGSEFKFKEKIFISWVGLRGAVPIILATFPMIVGIHEAQWIFNVVFFIVITSAFLQGWSIPWVARWLQLDIPASKKLNIVSEFGNLEETNRALVDFIIPENSTIIKKPIVELPELKGSLIVTVKRENHYFVPSGGTVLESGDELQMLVANEKLEELQLVFERKNQ